MGRKPLLRTKAEAVLQAQKLGISFAELPQYFDLAQELLEECAKHKQDMEKYLPAIAAYKPSPGQLALHNSLKDIRLGTGGNQSGKTECLIMDAAFHLLRCYPDWYKGRRFPFPQPNASDKERLRFRFVCASRDNGLDNIVIPRFESILPLGFIVERKKNSCGDISGFVTYYGDYISFMTYNQKAIEFASDQFDGIYLDEPPPEDIFDECRARTFMRGGFMMLDATFVWENTWLLDKLMSPEYREKVFHVCLRTKDNPAMTAENYRKLEEKYAEDEEMKQARLEGKPPHLTGLVFKEFSTARHVVPWFWTPDEEFSHYMAIDPHGRKSWCISWWAVSRKDKKYVIDEAYKNLHTYRDIALTIALKEKRITEEEFEQAQSWDKAAIKKMLFERFHGSGKGMIIWARIMDTSGWERDPDTDRPKADELAEYGIICQQADKTEQYTTLHQWLAPHPEPELYFMDNCVEHIYQFANVIYDDFVSRTARDRNDKRERIRPKRADFIDLARYMSNYGPTYMRLGCPDNVRREIDSARVNDFCGFARPLKYASSY